MKQYKTIKRKVPKTIYVEETEQIPTWYYKFLIWIFGHNESKIDLMLLEERRHAWTNAFSKATKMAHSTKEDAMQKKLAELGYEVQCNFPMARKLNPDEPPTEPFDPAKAWEIISKTPSKENK